MEFFSNFGNTCHARLENNGHSFLDWARNGAADLECAGGTGTRAPTGVRTRNVLPQPSRRAPSLDPEPAVCAVLAGHQQHRGHHCPQGAVSTAIHEARQAWVVSRQVGRSAAEGTAAQALRPARRRGRRELRGGRAPNPPTDEEASGVRGGACRLLCAGVCGGPGAVRDGWGRERGPRCGALSACGTRTSREAAGAGVAA